jgi:hypothetical protein
VAVVVTLATIIVCFIGIRAELNQAKHSPGVNSRETTLKSDAGLPVARDGDSRNIETAPVIDQVSAVRGSLGASLEDLSLSNSFGKLVIFLNGGFALLAGLLAVILARKRSSRVLPGVDSKSRRSATFSLHRPT